jgi:hypothetical protein
LWKGSRWSNAGISRKKDKKGLRDFFTVLRMAPRFLRIFSDLDPILLSPVILGP